MFPARSRKRPTAPRAPAQGVSKARQAKSTPSSELGAETALSTNFRKPYESQRRNAIEAMRLKGEGLTHAEIAKHLGYKNAHTVSDLFYHAGQQGWFITSDVEEHLTYVTSHKIVRNIDKALDEAGGLSAGQLDMTIAAAKGRGFFKHYESTKNEGAPQSLILGVKIEVTGAGSGVKALPAEGTIGGAPNYLEGDVVATDTELG